MTQARGLAATTTRLDGDIDLLAVAGGDGFVWEREGCGLAGRGVAARLVLDGDDWRDGIGGVAAFLAEIEVTDGGRDPGTGPVAVAALPFLCNDRAEVLVPALVAGRSVDGARWATVVHPVGESPPEVPPLAALPTQGAGPQSYEVTATRSPEAWCEAVAAVRATVRSGDVDKVVLAREVVVTADSPLDLPALLGRLRSAYPKSHLFCVDGFCGASPELLVSRHGDVVRSHPMAGTRPRLADPAADSRMAASLLASAKERAEHQLTIDMVHETLLRWCSFLDAEAEPSVVAMANVQHLATLVEGRLSDPPPSVLEMVAALHPTPAVGGVPRERALEIIDEVETTDRGRYAGPVGWVDADGNGEWAVGIRSAQVEGATARLHAGVGVVADSDPTAELAESRAKLQALLSAIVTP